MPELRRAVIVGLLFFRIMYTKSVYNTRERGVREFPAICREEEMDRMVVLLGLRAEVRVDHFTDGCCPVFVESPVQVQ